MASFFPVVGRIDQKLITTISTYTPDISNQKMLFYWGSSSELVIIEKRSAENFDVMFPSTVTVAKKPELIAIIKEHTQKLLSIFAGKDTGTQLLFKAARTSTSTSLDIVTEESFLSMEPWKAEQVFMLTDDNGVPHFPVYYVAIPDWKDLTILLSVAKSYPLSAPQKADNWSIYGRRIITALAILEGARTTAKHVDRAELYKLAVRQAFPRGGNGISVTIPVSTETLDDLAKKALPFHPAYKKASMLERSGTASRRVPYTDLFEYGAVAYSKTISPGDSIEIDASGLEEQFHISIVALMLNCDGTLHLYTSAPHAAEANRGVLEELFLTDVKIHLVKES